MGPDDSFGLRPWQDADAGALVDAWSDPELLAWLDPPTADMEAAVRWIRAAPDRRAAGVALDLVIDVDGVVAGEIGFSSFATTHRACLAGYWVGSRHRGNGLAAHALTRACAWVVEHTGPLAVVAECDPANRASQLTAERAGFELLSASHGGRRVYVCR
jgi:ribosomal-protein-alanine N-acetyltransferase